MFESANNSTKKWKDIYLSDCEGLFKLSTNLFLHQKHLQSVLTEICKSSAMINRQFMWSFFKEARKS